MPFTGAILPMGVRCCRHPSDIMPLRKGFKFFACKFCGWVHDKSVGWAGPLKPCFGSFCNGLVGCSIWCWHRYMKVGGLLGCSLLIGHGKQI